MAGWPTTDPVDNAFTPVLSNGRVVIVYNTDVSWSYTLAVRYARRKRIPLANLFGYAFGTGVHWIPANTAAIHTMTALLEAHWDTVQAQCVLLAPGCPNGVQITGVFDQGSNSGGSTGSFNAGAVGYPDLAKLCAGVRRWNDFYDTYGAANMCAGLFSGTDYHWHLYRASPFAVGYVFSEYSTFPSPAYWLRGTGSIASYQASYEPEYDEYPLASDDVHIPAQVLLDTLGNSSNLMLPYGRIGLWWNTYGIYPQPDPSPYSLDFDTSARVMEYGLRYSEACSPGNRYRSPIHFQLQSQVGQGGVSYQAKILRDNGYNVTYNYTGTPSATQESYCPAASAGFSLADLQAGKILDWPYHVMVGTAYPNYATASDSPYVEPWKSAFKPTGGGGSFLCPSFGYGTALVGLDRGGASGLTNASHITSGFWIGMQTMLECLLRGLTWAEASFFSHECGQHTPPVGDPLARPFPL